MATLIRRFVTNVGTMDPVVRNEDDEIVGFGVFDVGFARVRVGIAGGGVAGVVPVVGRAGRVHRRIP